MKYAYREFEHIRAYKYGIRYDTRKDSEAFLQSIGNPETAIQAQGNVDYYYMQQAWDAIEEWAKEHELTTREFLTDIGAKVEEHVMLIWYEVGTETDPVDLFRRVNIGRIPLTNSELVKAVLLTNASPSDRKTISYGWDDLERRLQDDQLWYFLVNNDSEEDDRRTRIDLLLDIWLSLQGEQARGIASDHFGPFYAVDSLIQESRAKGGKPAVQAEVHKIWQEIKDIFSQLEYWFSDHTLYHRIGFLLAVGSTPTYLYTALEALDKDAVNQRVVEAIQDVLRTGGRLPTQQTLGDLDFTRTKERDLIRKLLLLFNVETVLADGDDYVRFSYEAYKKERWDLEHIHAIADKPPGDRPPSCCSLEPRS